MPRLLVRLGWQRDRDLWTVRYRDEHGRRAHPTAARACPAVTGP
ncbi:MAG: hypothetical protein ACRDTF_09340 [Pseudonocardiaceae bacterium]